MNNNLWFGVIFGALFLTIIYVVAVVLIAVLRRALWWFSGLFFFLDEVMWFLYNPLRPLMKNREGKANRVFFFLFTMVLLKPVWQLIVWALTTPLRLITALYFDVLGPIGRFVRRITLSANNK